MNVTIDTGVLPIEELQDCLHRLGWTIRITSVTDRELCGTSFIDAVSTHPRMPETAVWDESRWDDAVWASSDDAARFETILRIISSGSFPQDRSNLSEGQRRQLRDALVFDTHVRCNGDIFVTSDQRAFTRAGRREILQGEYQTRILTRAKVEALCNEAQNEAR